LIETWRKLWGRDFPFYYVQLANWRPATNDPSGGNREWQYGRMAQLQCLSIPKTGMAVAIDIGDADDIHPRNKFDVGERLALWALAKDYGKTDLVYSGPLYAGTTVEGSRIRVRFTSVGAGLMVGDKVGRSPVKEQSGGKLARFAIAGADKKWFWADAAIDGDTVVVSSPQVTTPVAVRYAFAQNPAGCNLYNRAGLPASPFRTDDW
jgi:sialate O-acetylesterase